MWPSLQAFFLAFSGKRSLFAVIALLQASTAFSSPQSYFIPAAAAVSPELADALWPAREILPVDQVYIKQGHFYQGRDQKAKRIAFWGINLVGGGNFPDAAEAERLVNDLRRLGVNLVRLHHMDTGPDPYPERALSILLDKPYPTFNPVSVRRLKYFLGLCRKNGIYVNLNLHVGFTFNPQRDRVPHWSASKTDFPKYSKPLNIFYPALVEAQKTFTRNLINLLGLKGDPVLAMVEVNNESSLYQSWAWGELDASLKGAYRDYFRMLWAKSGRAQRFDDLIKGGGSDEERRDFSRFLAVLDAAFIDQMSSVIKTSTRADMPVTGTQVNYGGMPSFGEQKIRGYLDNHFYFDHYRFDRSVWDKRDWYITDRNALKDPLGLLNLAVSRVQGYPYVVSEYNQPWPSSYGHSFPLLMAYIGAAQDWDGLIYFAYAHDRNYWRAAPSGFDLNGDVSRRITYLVASLLFRQQSWGQREYCTKANYSPSGRAALMIEKNVRDSYSAFVGPMIDRGLLGVPVAGSVMAGDVAKTCKYESGAFFMGEKYASWDGDTHIGLVGELPDGRLDVKSAELRLTGSVDAFSVVGAIALDGMPVAQSGKLLIYDVGGVYLLPPAGQKPLSLQRPGVLSGGYAILDRADGRPMDLYAPKYVSAAGRTPIVISWRRSGSWCVSRLSGRGSPRNYHNGQGALGLQSEDGAQDEFGLVFTRGACVIQ
jgi:hypothetical protein